MKVRTLFIMASIYLVLAGLGFILVPRVFGIGAVPADASPELNYLSAGFWQSPAGYCGARLDGT